jgi:hypothetical protein
VFGLLCLNLKLKKLVEHLRQRVVLGLECLKELTLLVVHALPLHVLCKIDLFLPHGLIAHAQHLLKRRLIIQCREDVLLFPRSNILDDLLHFRLHVRLIINRRASNSPWYWLRHLFD